MIGIKRQDFFLELQQKINRAAEVKQTLACVLVDVENLLYVNQEFGYDVGETLLEECFHRLQDISKFNNCVFRICSNQFAFILPVVQSSGFTILALNKIIKTLEEPVSIRSVKLAPVVRLGVCLNDCGVIDNDLTVSHAERSLESARLSREPFSLSEGMEDGGQYSSLGEKFLKALSANEFELYYQPKIDFKTGKTLRAEALLRWDLEGVGFVSPEKVVDMAERSGQSYTLTKWVLNTALRQLKKWQDAGENITVAVNVTAGLVHHPDLYFMVKDSLAIWGVEPRMLTIEITESGIIEDKKSGYYNLQKIKDFGVKLAIDDFGTGYSSLSYFKEIPANELKIDKSFILRLLENPQDQKLVRLIIELAHMFNLEVVAEGVESLDCYLYLKTLGCDYGQGFYMSKPLPAEEFFDFLQMAEAFY